MGHVQGQHRDRRTAVEDDLGRVGIDEHIELGSGCGVAPTEEPAAHADDLSDASSSLRGGVQHRGHIGHRAHRTDGYLPLSGYRERLDHPVHRVLGLQGGCGIGQICPVDAGLAVNMLGCDQLPAHRTIAAGVHRHIGATGKFADDAGISGGEFPEGRFRPPPSPRALEVRGRPARPRWQWHRLVRGRCR